MANPLANEDKIYQRLQKEKVTIDPDVRELINHHIRNDINFISVGIGQYAFVPDEILKEAYSLIRKRYKELGQPGEPPPDLITLYKGTMKRCKDIVGFLNKLMQALDHNPQKETT